MSTTPARRRTWRHHPRPRRPDVLVQGGAEPLAEITIYDEFTLLTRRQGPHWRSYPINPTALAQTLARVPTSSGLLPPNTLATGHVAGTAWYVCLVPPATRTLRTEHAEFRIPLPPLIWAGAGQEYRLFALNHKDSPTLHAPLCVAPFPNVYADGRICWGTADPRPDATGMGLHRVLDLFLEGSLFNQHLANQKSERYPVSVIARWQATAKRPTRGYPLRDLVASRFTLRDMVEDQGWISH